MSPHQILAACSRLGAIVWAICVIRQAPELWLHTNHPAVDNRTSLFVLTFLQLAMCAFLWLFPTAVARSILSAKETGASPPARLADWQMLGTVLIGLWAFTQAVPRMFYWAIVIHTLQSKELGGLADLSAAQTGQIAATAAELVIAIGLVFGARTINANY